MDLATIVMLFIVVLSVLSNNSSVAIASAILLLLKLTHFSAAFPPIEKYGLNLGIIILTLAILSPLVSGKIEPMEIIDYIKKPSSLFVILTGVFTTYLAGRGVKLLTAEPEVVTGLIVGTVIGVAFFQGVPIGPLISAGIVAMIFKFIH